MVANIATFGVPNILLLVTMTPVHALKNVSIKRGDGLGCQHSEMDPTNGGWGIDRCRVDESRWIAHSSISRYVETHSKDGRYYYN